MASQPGITISIGDSSRKGLDSDQNPQDDDGSSSSGSESGRSSIDDEGGNGLFIQSTISRDDTLGKKAKKRALLSKFGSQFDNRPLQLNSSRDVREPFGADRGLLRPTSPSFAPNIKLDQKIRGSPTRPPPGPPPPANFGPPPGFRPGPPPGMYPPPPPGWVGPGRMGPPMPPRTVPLRYPPKKAWKNAKWRQKVQARRGPVLASESEQDQKSETHDAPVDLDSNSNSANKSKDESNKDSKDLGSHETQESHAAQEIGMPDGPGFAESLSALAEKHLNIDVLDQNNEVYRYVSYLLDTIQMLESRAGYREAASSTATSSDSDSEVVPDSPSPPAPCSTTVHRIFCNRNYHNHNWLMYEDEPVTRKLVQPWDTGGIEARQEIVNLSAYLDRNPQFCFIIIKEHDCARGQKTNSDNKSASTSGRAERLKIVSPVLLKAIEDVAEFQLYEDDEGDETEMNAPYPFLFHHRSKLAELEKVDSYRPFLAPLLGFLKDNYEKEYAEAEDMFRQGYVNAYHLPKLFKPNSMVIVRKRTETINAYVLDKYVEVLKEKVEVFGWSWEYNGVDLERSFWKDSLKSLSDEKTLISDLNIHPIEYAKDQDIKKLTARGKKYWEMREQVYTCYTGWDRSHTQYYVAARFMVDTVTYRMMHRGSTTSGHEDAPKYDKWPMQINRREDISFEATMLLPATISGFNLHEKKWVTLNVEGFHPVNWNKKAFKRLVLDDKTKEMIYALVDVQTSATKMNDIITGKGNGLIILLHGSPGTGKTLTAESVAEIAEKPLYRVTCGDIGTEAREVEQYLETVLYLGKTWDCVLLLDEADVFLEERTMADLQRNSLVSVFLRILEYYEGILILTSNRVGTFDEAFKSRIQVAIHYDSLTKKSRKQIWQNFFDMIEESTEEDANIPELERRLDQLASEEMNGRQIRNALLTARQLAKHRKERLDWEHLSQVMKTSASFNKYLKAIRGHSDEQWAREEMLR